MRSSPIRLSMPGYLPNLSAERPKSKVPFAMSAFTIVALPAEVEMVVFEKSIVSSKITFSF